MTRHAKPTRMLRPLNKRQWMKIAAVVAAAGLLARRDWCRAVSTMLMM